MKLVLSPVAPFDFSLSASIFSDGDKQIRKYSEGKYWQVIRIMYELVLVVISSIGEIDSPKLFVELRGKRELSNEHLHIAKEIVSNLFNLDFDLTQFYKEVSCDPVMLELIELLRGLKSPTTQTVFEALISSIVEQQISLDAAFSLQKRMIRTFGDAVKINENLYYAFPTAKILASATIEQLRSCGLSTRKAEYVKDIATLVSNDQLDLEAFTTYKDTNEIVDELCKLRGVGVWTAELTLIRGMHKLEAIPADDLGLRKIISHYYCNDRAISSEEARTIAKKWGTWRGLAGFYLIMAGRQGIEV
jgi:DNA-3-methyladenine glycosylase II